MQKSSLHMLDCTSKDKGSCPDPSKIFLMCYPHICAAGTRQTMTISVKGPSDGCLESVVYKGKWRVLDWLKLEEGKRGPLSAAVW